MNETYKAGSWNAICNMCGESKESTEFYLHSNGKPRKQCKKCHYIKQKAWATHNKNLRNAKNKQARNPEKANLATQKWRKANLSYDAYRARTYRARKLQAIPIWANLNKVKEIYENCPIGYHVDHMIPLKGKDVCGLHVEYNLQYLPALENIRKRNFYEQLL